METDGEYYDHEQLGDVEEEGYFGWGEIAVSTISHDEALDQTNCIRFDAAEESLWLGSGTGMLVQDLCPSLERFSVIAAHHEAIMVLKSIGESVVSLSPSQLCFHNSGCVPRLSFADEVSSWMGPHSYLLWGI